MTTTIEAALHVLSSIGPAGRRAMVAVGLLLMAWGLLSGVGAGVVLGAVALLVAGWTWWRGK